jgi:hypothetical protein
MVYRQIQQGFCPNAPTPKQEAPRYTECGVVVGDNYSLAGSHFTQDARGSTQRPGVVPNKSVHGSSRRELSRTRDNFVKCVSSDWTRIGYSWLREVRSGENLGLQYEVE